MFRKRSKTSTRCALPHAMKSVFASADTAKAAGPSQLSSRFVAAVEVAPLAGLISPITVVAKTTSRIGATLAAVCVLPVARVQ